MPAALIGIHFAFVLFLLLQPGTFWEHDAAAVLELPFSLFAGKMFRPDFWPFLPWYLFALVLHSWLPPPAIPVVLRLLPVLIFLPVWWRPASMDLQMETRDFLRYATLPLAVILLGPDPRILFPASLLAAGSLLPRGFIRGIALVFAILLLPAWLALAWLLARLPWRRLARFLPAPGLLPPALLLTLGASHLFPLCLEEWQCVSFPQSWPSIRFLPTLPVLWLCARLLEPSLALHLVRLLAIWGLAELLLAWKRSAFRLPPPERIAFSMVLPLVVFWIEGMDGGTLWLAWLAFAGLSLRARLPRLLHGILLLLIVPGPWILVAILGTLVLARRRLDRYPDWKPPLARGLLVLILLAAALLRLQEIRHAVVCVDGWASWRFGQGSLITLLDTVARLDCHPPLFYLGQWFSQTLLGDGPLGVHLPGLLVSLAIPAATFFWVRSCAGETAALLAAAWLSFHPWLIYHSGYVRMYSLLLLLSVLALGETWHLLHGNLGRSARAEKRLGFLSLLLVLTHYTGILLVLVLIGFCLLEGEAGRAALGRAWRKGWFWLVPALCWGIFVFLRLRSAEILPLTYQVIHPSPTAALALLGQLIPAAASGVWIWFPLVFLLLPCLPLPGPRLPPILVFAGRIFWALALAHYLQSFVISRLTGAGILQRNHLIPLLAPLALAFSWFLVRLRPRFLMFFPLVVFLGQPLAQALTDSYGGEINPWKSFQASRRFAAGWVIEPAEFALEAFGPQGAVPRRLDGEGPAAILRVRVQNGGEHPDLSGRTGPLGEKAGGTLIFGPQSRRWLAMAGPPRLAVDLRGWPGCLPGLVEDRLIAGDGRVIPLVTGEITEFALDGQDWRLQRTSRHFSRWLNPDHRERDWEILALLAWFLSLARGTGMRRPETQASCMSSRPPV